MKNFPLFFLFRNFFFFNGRSWKFEWGSATRDFCCWNRSVGNGKKLVFLLILILILFVSRKTKVQPKIWEDFTQIHWRWTIVRLRIKTKAMEHRPTRRPIETAPTAVINRCWSQKIRRVNWRIFLFFSHWKLFVLIQGETDDEEKSDDGSYYSPKVKTQRTRAVKSVLFEDFP